MIDRRVLLGRHRLEVPGEASGRVLLQDLCEFSVEVAAIFGAGGEEQRLLPFHRAQP
jgi:hypothetical protein